MKEFEIDVDVTMSGTVSVSAETEEEAKQKAVEKYFVASDLRNFHQIDVKLV